MTPIDFDKLVEIANDLGDTLRVTRGSWKQHMADLGVDPDAALSWAPVAVEAMSGTPEMPPECWLIVGFHYGLEVSRKLVIA